MPIRNAVTFRHPAEFVSTPSDEGVLAVGGAAWFVDVLAKVPRLELESDLCQEDWGVAIFGRRDAFSFWFGVSFWDEGMWVAHVHRRGLFQRAAARSAYVAVIHDLGLALREEPLVADTRWYIEEDLGRSDARGVAMPDAG